MDKLTKKLLLFSCEISQHRIVVYEQIRILSGFSEGNPLDPGLNSCIHNMESVFFEKKRKLYANKSIPRNVYKITKAMQNADNFVWNNHCRTEIFIINLSIS